MSDKLQFVVLHRMPFKLSGKLKFVGPALTAAVSRVAIRADQKRHMIVLRRIIDLEHQSYLRIEILDAEFREIMFGIEHQAVSAARERFFNQKEGLHAAVFVGPGMTKLSPRFIRVLDVKMNSNATSGRATRDVEYMRRDGAHNESGVYSLESTVNKNNYAMSFRNRSSVIFACSAAAMRNSSSALFAKRSRRIPSISSELLPDAHTMKM